MTATRSRIREEARFRLLRLLEQNPEMSQRDLAAAVGISTGGTHYMLTSLVREGLVKIGNFSASTDKRRYAYVLTPRGLLEKASLTRQFLRRKTREYDALKAEIDDLRTEIEADASRTPDG